MGVRYLLGRRARVTFRSVLIELPYLVYVAVRVLAAA